MPTPLENMKAAVGVAVCNGLDEIGNTLLYSGARALSTGAGAKPGLLMIGAGALSYYLQQTGCGWTDTGGNTNQPPIPGCWGGTGGFVQVWQQQPMFPDNPESPVTVNMVQFLGWITPFNFEVIGNADYSTAYAQYDYIGEDGEQARGESIIRGDLNLRPSPMYMKSFAGEGQEFICEIEEEPNEPVLMPSQEVDYGDCNYTVNHLGWGLNTDSDLLYSVHEVLPGATNGVRAGGGRMGGCNFEPTLIVYGGDGGGGTGVPIPPVPIPGDDGEPWWVDLAKQAAATAAGNLIANAIRALLTQPYEGVLYQMPAPCDVDAEGNQLVWTGSIPPQAFQKATLDRLDALSNQMAQHLAWKTPICGDVPVEVEGEWRKISFRSDEVSPYGTNRLRKYLRYRSVSGLGLGELVDHWKDFTWLSGPTRVRHSGASWGTVEVWASSLDEGKRVIQHAAREAGVDTAEAGRWTDRVSSSTRLGVSLLMRVDTSGGFYWITDREGSDGRPIVATGLDQ